MRFQKYNVILDFADPALADALLSCLFDMPFLGDLCVLETDGGVAEDSLPRFRRDLVIFEDRGMGAEDMKKYCLSQMTGSPGAIFISVGESTHSFPSLPLICMSKTLLLGQFSNLIGFCYLTAVIRRSVANVKKESSRRR